VHIKEAAKRLNISARAIRFYEEKGLIAPAKGPNNQYRMFQEKDVWRLQTIIALRESGMTIEDIKQALANIEGEDYEELLYYLELQRSVMFAKWLEIRGTIEMTDHMIQIVRTEEKLPLDDIYQLAERSKRLRDQRSNWQDRWNFDKQALEHDERVLHAEAKYRDYEAALALTVQWVAPLAGERGLDIGTGTGNLAKKLIEHGARMAGVDQSKEMLKRCREKLPEMETKLGNFLALPYLEEQFDFAVTSFAFHHLSEPQQVLAIEEMRRVLKPHGRICITDLMVSGKQEKPLGSNESYIHLEKLIEVLEQRRYVVKWQQLNEYLHILYAIPIR